MVVLLQNKEQKVTFSMFEGVGFKVHQARTLTKPIFPTASL